MSYSINEIQTLAQKAARGAGFPPAQAESFGRAAVVHLATGGAAQPLLDALRNPNDSPVIRLPLLMDDVLRAARVLGEGITLSLQAGDGDLAPSYTRMLPIEVRDIHVEHVPDAPARLHVRADARIRATPKLPARIMVPAELIEKLTDLAARTYVPATDASRQSGAGAGLNDND